MAELRAAVSEAAGRAMQIEFVLEAGEAPPSEEKPRGPTSEGAVGSKAWVAERMAHPLVAAVAEAFGSAPTRVDPPSG